MRHYDWLAALLVCVLIAFFGYCYVRSQKHRHRRGENEPPKPAAVGARDQTAEIIEVVARSEEDWLALCALSCIRDWMTLHPSEPVRHVHIGAGSSGALFCVFPPAVSQAMSDAERIAAPEAKP